MKSSTDHSTRVILIVTHQFPPVGGIGVQRILRFLRGLPGHGWQPVVLASIGRDYQLKDPALLDHLNPAIRVIRADLPHFLWKLLPRLQNVKKNDKKKLGYHFWIYDDFYAWIPFVVHSGRKIIKQFRPRAIFASGGPFCSLVAAHRLSRIGKIPLLVDFRDGWSACEYRRDRGNFPKWIEGTLENIILRDSAKAFFATRGLLDRYIENYPSCAHKFTWLPNGFDLGNLPQTKRYAASNPGRLQVKYVGKFTHYRRPDAFLRGLRKAVYDLQCDDIDIEFVGGLDVEVREFIKQMSLSKYVKIREFVPHSNALEMMHQADALLLVVDRTPGYQVIQTGKIFEYMATGKPILCVSPLDSEAAKTVEEEKLGVTVAPEDESGIADILVQWAKEKKQHGTLSSPDYALPDRYKQERIVEELSHNLIEADTNFQIEKGNTLQYA